MGHLGIALAGKGIHPRVPLWTLVAASLASDLLDVFIGLVGMGGSASYLPTHSLPGGFGIALVAALAYAAFTRDRAGASLVGFAAFSHVLADLLTSRLPAWPGGPEIGLHLYRYDAADFVIEAALVLAGWLLYRRSLAETQHGSWAVWMILVVLLGFQLYFQMLPIT